MTRKKAIKFIDTQILNDLWVEYNHYDVYDFINDIYDNFESEVSGVPGKYGVPGMCKECKYNQVKNENMRSVNICIKKRKSVTMGVNVDFIIPRDTWYCADFENIED